MAEIRIIPAPLALKPRILDLSRATYAEHRARQPWAFPENGFETTVVPNVDAAFRQGGRELQESPSAFAAYLGDDFAGYVLLSSWARPGGLDMPHVSIEDIRVLPEMRGKGVGTALLSHVKALAEARDWDSLVATVWDGNTASQEMFEAAGFHVQARNYRIGPNRSGRNYPAASPWAGIQRRLLRWLLAILLLVSLVAMWILLRGRT